MKTLLLLLLAQAASAIVPNDTVRIATDDGVTLSVSIPTTTVLSIGNIANVTVATGSITAFQGGAWSSSVSNFPASQSVTGPLTNGELRASSIAVRASQSGPWYINNSTFDVTGSAIISYQGGPWTVATTTASTVSSPVILSTINESSRTVTTSSTQFYVANASRQNLNCWSFCTNTDFVLCRFSSTALTTSSIYIPPCSSWYTPPGTAPINAFSCIANSGSQVIRCVEYTLP